LIQRCGNSLKTCDCTADGVARSDRARARRSSSRKTIYDQLRAKRHAAETPSWFQQAHPLAPLTCVAHSSMEFVRREALPVRSRWLGNLAGDQLKAATGAVPECTEQHNLPASAAYRERSANQGATGSKSLDWQRAMDQKWGLALPGELRSPNGFPDKMK